MQSTNLSRQQLTIYYTDWVQEQRRAQPLLKASRLWKQLSAIGLRIAGTTFVRWWVDLPLPLEPMDEPSANVALAQQPMDEGTESDMPETPMNRVG